MPRKVFVAGEILTAADVNTNLADQAVMTFAGTAARGSAIGTAVEGMVTYLEDTDQLEVYDGSNWLSASNFLFGTATPTDGQVVSYSTAVSGYVPADAATGGATGNLLYNGAMQVAQRGTSATGLGNNDTGYHTADRWKFVDAGAPTAEFTQTVEADAPTGSGLANSLKIEITTAESSLSAGVGMIIVQPLEGQDLQGLKKGTSDAESLTISFWTKSDTTGTYIVELFDYDNSRQISASYTVSSADTWENKTVTFDGDTSGVLDNDNGSSLSVNFWLAAGSDFSSGTLNTSWASNTDANRAASQTNLAASTGNYWQVTGVQLETGTVASGFDHKPYGVELAECQRYYVDLTAGNARASSGWIQTASDARVLAVTPVSMRDIPSVTGFTDVRSNGGSFVASAVSVLSGAGTVNGAMLSLTISGASANHTAVERDGGELDAEL